MLYCSQLYTILKLETSTFAYKKSFKSKLLDVFLMFSFISFNQAQSYSVLCWLIYIYAINKAEQNRCNMMK